MKFLIFSLLNYKYNLNEKFNNDYIFNKVSIIHNNILYKNNFTEVSYNYDLNHKNSTIKNGIYQNYNFNNNNFRKVRITYFKSDDHQIFRSLWFPSYDFAVPILSIDLVQFKTNVSLFFLHLNNIYKDSNYIKQNNNPFYYIKNKYNNTVKINNHLISFNNYLNDACIFENIYNDYNFETYIPELIENYLETYFKLFLKKPVNKLLIEDSQKLYSDFRKTFDNNLLLKNYYDKEWYNNMLNDAYK